MNDRMMIDTGTRFDAVDLADDAKWTYAKTISELWETSLQLAEWGVAGRLTLDEVWPLQRRLTDVAQTVYRHCMDSRAGDGTIDVPEVYSDGSPMWSRVTPAGPAPDERLHEFLSGDLLFWVGGLQGELPLGTSVVAHQPPYFRDENPSPSTTGLENAR